MSSAYTRYTSRACDQCPVQDVCICMGKNWRASSKQAISMRGHSKQLKIKFSCIHISRVCKKSEQIPLSNGISNRNLCCVLMHIDRSLFDIIADLTVLLT